MVKIIQLIHDKFENNFGFIEGSHETNIHDIINQINELSCVYQPSTIYSWGVRKDIVTEDCEIIFDVTLFFTKINDSSALSKMSGKDTEIQNSIILHPRFLDLLKEILTYVDQDRPKNIAFICNYGKHRSVGWAEIVKKYFYNSSQIKHLTLLS